MLEEERPAIERVRARIDAIYDSGTALAPDGEQVPLYHHGVSRLEGEMLRDLVIREEAAATIEVGFAMGLSALFIAEGLLAVGRAEATHVVLDPAQHHWRDVGLQTVADAGVADRVELIRERSQTALPRMWTEGRRFDFAFVDGDHHFESVFLDVYFLARLVRPGGLIVLDDVWMPSVQKAIKYFERNTSLALDTEGHPGAFSWSSVRRFRRSRSSVALHDQLGLLRVPAGGPADPGEFTDF